MKTRFSKIRGKSAFTLVELIVVIGLMGLLATISTGGYFAATRGMASRGAIQDTASIIRAAMQSCLIDQVPTAVLFCNYRSDTKAKGGDCYGRAIAIRMAGRVSLLSSSGFTSEGESISHGLLIDEFGDWNIAYALEATVGKRQLGIQLYNMSEDKLKQGIEKCASLMCAWVGYTQLDRDYMISTGKKAADWCSDLGIKSNTQRWGLPFHEDNNGLGINDWKIGDAYGTQIAEFTLPRNYIFGTSAPKDTTLEAAKPTALVFFPDEGKETGLFTLGSSVTITMLKDTDGNNKEEVGQITDDIIKDQD